jgi:hypothetical protein
MRDELGAAQHKGSPAKSIPIRPCRASQLPPIRGLLAASFRNLSAAAKLRSRGVIVRQARKIGLHLGKFVSVGVARG